tara:strand:- start:28182 stop:28436 length:255 start_codon:yes stop_codon:yes gene_type:complete
MKNQDIRDKVASLGNRIVSEALNSIGDDHIAHRLKKHITEIDELLIDIEKSHKDAGLYGKISRSADEMLEITEDEEENDVFWGE